MRGDDRRRRAFLSNLILASSLVSTATASRVLVTPIAQPAATPRERPPPGGDVESAIDLSEIDDLPCAVRLVSDELPPCVCYPRLPAACTRLLASGAFGVSATLDSCGARVGGLVIPPDSCEGGYYGHDSTLDPESVLQNGLPARGDDWDLLRHAEQTGNSAFRGTTKLVTYPDGGGAAAWADEGGYVYEVTCVPSWDVNLHLQGRRLVSELAVGARRFGGNLAGGEHEHAIPARVPPEHIKRVGSVVTSAAGVPFVPRSSWVDNPRWDPCFCRYSLSECDTDEVPCH